MLDMENNDNIREGNSIENNFDKSVKSHKLSDINQLSLNIQKELNEKENIISNIKEKHFNEIIKSHKKFIFKKNYGNKVDSIYDSNKETNKKSKKLSVLKPKNISLEEYIEKIKREYKEHPVFFESINKYNNEYHYLFSFCFFCHNPAVACDNKVICVNGCLNLDVRTEEFSDNYTLDKFLNQHYDFISDHLLCEGDVTPLFVDGEGQTAFFICNKCDKDVFKKAGMNI